MTFPVTSWPERRINLYCRFGGQDLFTHKPSNTEGFHRSIFTKRDLPKGKMEVEAVLSELVSAAFAGNPCKGKDNFERVKTVFSATAVFEPVDYPRAEQGNTASLQRWTSLHLAAPHCAGFTTPLKRDVPSAEQVWRGQEPRLVSTAERVIHEVVGHVGIHAEGGFSAQVTELPRNHDWRRVGPEQKRLVGLAQGMEYKTRS